VSSARVGQSEEELVLLDPLEAAALVVDEEDSVEVPPELPELPELPGLEESVDPLLDDSFVVDEPPPDPDFSDDRLSVR